MYYLTSTLNTADKHVHIRYPGDIKDVSSMSLEKRRAAVEMLLSKAAANKVDIKRMQSQLFRMDQKKKCPKELYPQKAASYKMNSKIMYRQIHRMDRKQKCSKELSPQETKKSASSKYIRMPSPIHRMDGNNESFKELSPQEMAFLRELNKERKLEQ